MYNEEGIVPYLRSAVARFMSELAGETEVVQVNDGSTHSTLRERAARRCKGPYVRTGKGAAGSHGEH